MTRSEPKNIKELFTYRLNRLAHSSSRMTAHINESQHDLGSRDWRLIGLLGAFAPLSLNSLADEAGIDKSQASRSVSDLIERGLVKRGTDEADARGVKLELTTKGKAAYRKVFPRAVERNEKILAVLTVQERAVLERAIEKLTSHTGLLFEELKAKPRGKSSSSR